MAAIRVRCTSNLSAKLRTEPPDSGPRPFVLALGSRRRRRHSSGSLVARTPHVAPERRRDRRPTPLVVPAADEEPRSLERDGRTQEDSAPSEAEESVVLSQRRGDGESQDEAAGSSAGPVAERIGGSGHDDRPSALARKEEELMKTIASFVLGEAESTGSVQSEQGNAHRQHSLAAEASEEEVSNADQVFKEEKVSESSPAAATNGDEQDGGSEQVLVSGIVLDDGAEEATTISNLLVGMDNETEGQNEDSVPPNVPSDVEENVEATEKEEQKQNKKTFSIVFVSSEAAPYSKTGGLGDVCGSLPIALASRGHRVMVISPRYLNGISNKNFAGAFDLQVRIKLPCFGGEQEVAFFHEYRAGVDWVFIDHPSYHRPGNPYGDGDGAFDDNQFRYALLCYAACEAPLVLPLGGYTYGQNCLFVVNDWHAGLVPVLLSAKYRPYGVYRDARSILVIHNLAHQGVEPATTYEYLGLPPEWYGALEWVFPTWARRHALDKGEAVNILKGAIVTSDRIVTVSQGYAWEITTVEGGQGLNEILANRKSVLNGITNGIDIDDWNPATDKHIPHHYSVEDLSGKAQCKAALQKELGLPVRDNCPMIGFIGRLDYQKGTDLFSSAVPELLQDDVQFVMLGSGDKDTEEWMKWAEATYRDKFRGWVGFNIPISHRITAGCDILLMPSRFEPCGLNQLYAMRYGTVPVVNCTGGLRDTVETFNPFANEGSGEGTGWRFSPLSKEAMLQALKMAIRTFKDHKSSWEGIMKRGMNKDFTWDSAAVQYEKIFEWASIDPPYVR